MLACFKLEALKIFCDSSSANILKTPTSTSGVETLPVTRNIFDKGDKCPSPNLATPLVRAFVAGKVHKSAIKVKHPFLITIGS